MAMVPSARHLSRLGLASTGIGAVFFVSVFSLDGPAWFWATEQHIYIVRHGDKYSSYPPCDETADDICFDAKVMGNNPPLTPCGRQQARYTADWLQQHARIDHVVVSPFTRTLQTALPLAEALNQQLKVEPLLSEARQDSSAFRAFNADSPGETVRDLSECSARWDWRYGAASIKTPENDTLYVQRVVEAVRTLKVRFPPSTGNIAIYTHATPSLSIAFGWCYKEGSSLKQFLDAQDAIGPAGVVHVIVKQGGSGSGTCTILQTQNVVDVLKCGRTPAYKCNFKDFPAWYWPNPEGRGPGLCS